MIGPVGEACSRSSYRGGPRSSPAPGRWLPWNLTRSTSSTTFDTQLVPPTYWRWRARASKSGMQASSLPNPETTRAPTRSGLLFFAPLDRAIFGGARGGLAPFLVPVADPGAAGGGADPGGPAAAGN